MNGTVSKPAGAHLPQSLAPGLYLVAVPIGTARDITLRALDILASADVIAAEDTRSMRHLLEIHGVPLGDRPLLAYHDHNGAQVRPKLLQALAEGKSVAYASEAGTPMVADPGFDLARAARAEGWAVTSAPGASAVITALTLAGLPTDRFLFAGFLPNASGQRKSAMAELAGVPATLAFYESPKRIAAMLRDAAEVLGPDRQAAVCRELTKKFEEVLTGTLEELAATCAERSLKGEIVVLVDRGKKANVSESDLDQILSEALEDMSVRDAADMVASDTGLPRRKVYQRALALEKAK
ncbi:16S rRNA (cytidine(1402)-2'-O)-methyltransferase [Pseudooceanicola nanhaiensis]|uniref:16S rRNA (cytidine(1402)-2'-O)-methyltransferase n=1 Tax=Pseudooceanicola nanhaiensis TaxID=375761 RepID=UPI001CD2F205|nr:16S rRNA (cytidine(1402)-2'-O)-methyltransferase [Pseudooceanicola nanhaiensis]MCA0919428.1 16S rRNA (cytidine(1402)-2'-O)-methyltransferase [Pseudooceanicola nanhaiensis]